MAIVGAGLTGLPVARHQACKGANMQAFGKSMVGFGAAGRGGGMEHHDEIF